VIAVGAIDSANRRASFSNYGTALELSAPGVGVLSTMPTYAAALNGAPYNYPQIYAFLDGTSMATPHVSGVAALVWAAHPSWTNVQVRQRLQATATDLGAPGKDKYYGYGLVNAAAAAAP
jgi:subtilisin/minor extracellular protease Epr